MWASSNQLDPFGFDETVETKFRWVTTVGAGSDFTLGRFTIFGKGGVAVADVDNSVTDIDYFRDRPPMRDPDDSFREVSSDFGWHLAAGLETALADAWALRLDAAYNGVRTEHLHRQSRPQQPLWPRRRAHGPASTP